MNEEWKIFLGTRQPHDRIRNLPSPPNWRNFSVSSVDSDELLPIPKHNPSDLHIGRHLGKSSDVAVLHPDADEVRMVNAAIYLRRPLLISGQPGTGKSSLAYAVAEELKLGPVLYWPITTRTQLRDGLYQYDAIGRLQRAQLRKLKEKKITEKIGDHLRLGPLGTAFLPWKYPRVLLIDELDKSDHDLTNDLLHLFEEGGFDIPELSRLGRNKEVRVWTADGSKKIPITGGHVQCQNFPIIVMTSNGDRDFPPAFYRRCIRLTINLPNEDKLRAMIQAHLENDTDPKREEMIKAFVKRLENKESLAADQLLNMLYLIRGQPNMLENDFTALKDALLRPLDDEPDSCIGT